MSRANSGRDVRVMYEKIGYDDTMALSEATIISDDPPVKDTYFVSLLLIKIQHMLKCGFTHRPFAILKVTETLVTRLTI